MKKLIVVTLAVAALCLVLSGLSIADEAEKAEAVKKEAKKVEMPAGQKVFTSAKCQMCHTVYSAAIGEPPAKESEKKESEKKDGPPDLSKAGVGRTAEQLSLFLQKKGALGEKTHMMKFAGSDEDLATLVDWLLTLKPAEEKTLKVTKVKKDEKTDEAEKAPKDEAAEKSSDSGHDHGDSDKAASGEEGADGHGGHDHGEDSGAAEEKGE